MIYIGNPIGSYTFKAKPNHSKQLDKLQYTYTFSMKSFCIVKTTDATAIIDNNSENVCFIFQIHFPSFVFKYFRTKDFIGSVSKFFVFDNVQDLNDFVKYLSNLQDIAIRKIDL